MSSAPTTDAFACAENAGSQFISNLSAAAIGSMVDLIVNFWFLFYLCIVCISVGSISEDLGHITCHWMVMKLTFVDFLYVSGVERGLYSVFWSILASRTG